MASHTPESGRQQSSLALSMLNSENLQNRKAVHPWVFLSTVAVSLVFLIYIYVAVIGMSPYIATQNRSLARIDAVPFRAFVALDPKAALPEPAVRLAPTMV